MSLEQALQFLRQVRNDQQLRTRIIDGQDEMTANELVAIGREQGYIFDDAELAQAYRHEWTMRRMHFRSRENNR